MIKHPANYNASTRIRTNNDFLIARNIRVMVRKRYLQGSLGAFFFDENMKNYFHNGNSDILTPGFHLLTETTATKIFTCYTAS
jgi:hypothetical protein